MAGAGIEACQAHTGDGNLRVLRGVTSLKSEMIVGISFYVHLARGGWRISSMMVMEPGSFTPETVDFTDRWDAES